MIISEIKYNQVIERLRFDAEYYQPEFLKSESMLKKCKDVSLYEISKFSKLRRNPENEPEKELKYIDISNVNISTGDITIQLLKGHQAPSRARKVVRENEIIISTVRPNRNAVAIITKELNNQICSTGFAVIKTEKINPWFLFAYLKTKYAINQLVRMTMASMYPAVSEDDIGSILVPISPSTFQQRIESYVKESYEKRKSADEKYKSAEELLNKTLGIEKLELKEEKIFETKFGEIDSSLRFDAEHYKPKYTQVKEFIIKSGYEVRKLKEVVKISNKKIGPSKEPIKLFNYIELANINPSTGEIEEVSQIKGYEAPSRARMSVKAGDVLVSSLLGSLDNIGFVPGELDSSVASTGFFVIRSDIFLPEFLFLLFRSNLMKLQLEEKTAGAIMSAVPKTTFGDLLIPVIPQEKQKPISDLIKQSFSLRKEAKELLEKAKREIEEFIGKNGNQNHC
ncbi:MAG: restriction endonuclease subunit S [Nanoarchaeota archaeon]|nr:restriction endonuclease subunit S [Nanoarchaeota archaeon]